MHLEGLRALDTWQPYGGDAKVQRHDDVSYSTFVAHELTQIVPKMYERVYPLLDAKTHVPTSVNVSPGAMAWAYDSMERRGRAEWMGANATQFPRVDIGRSRVSFPLRTSVLAYGWTIEEIEAARFAGQPLDTQKAEACRRGQAEFENDVILFGDASHGIPGFLTNPAIPRVAVPNGSWLGGSTTTSEILQDMFTSVNSVYTISGRAHRADTLLVAPEFWHHIMATPRSDTSDTTIAEFFLRTNGYIREIMMLPALSTASLTGGPAMIAYQKDPSVLSAIIPLAYQQMEPQVHGFETVIPTRQKLGGVVWFYPYAAVIADGL